MRRTHYFNRDGDEVSASRALRDGVLQNGYSVRVPTIFRDAASRFTDARSYWDRNKDALLVTDARGIGGTEGNRPGFRVLDAPINRQAVHDARARYLSDLQSAYKNPSTGFGEQGAIGQRAGDLCTLNGQAGRLRMVNGMLQCVPDRADAAPDEGRRECPDCEGAGYDQNGEQCRKCGGVGEIPDDDDADEEAESQSDAARRRRPPDDEPDDDDPPYGSQDAAPSIRSRAIIGCAWPKFVTPTRTNCPKRGRATNDRAPAPPHQRPRASGYGRKTIANVR